jgi:hypothetical protein
VNDFWAFTLSGAVVSWLPLIIGFVWHSRVIKRHIDTVTKKQDIKIEDLTKQQTRTIVSLTEAQTAELKSLP